MYLEDEYDASAEPVRTILFNNTIYGGNINVKDDGSGTVTVTYGYIASYNGETLPGKWISNKDEYAPNTSPSIGAEVVYELAEPVVYSLTSVETGGAIETIEDDNTIWCDTGDISVTYESTDPAPRYSFASPLGDYNYHTLQAFNQTYIEKPKL